MAITPWQYAAAGTEHSEQVALFMWAHRAARFGFAAACDEGLWATKLPPAVLSQPDALPDMHLLFAIPNGGSRGDTAKSRAIQGGKLKAEGVKSGVPDIMLPITLSVGLGGSPIPVFTHCGLFIELKVRETTKPGVRKAEIIDRAAGSTSDTQDSWHERLTNQGYRVVVCYGWQDAANAIMRYMGYMQ